MPKGEHNRKLSDAQRSEIFRRYREPLPDGTWIGVPTLAREYGVRPNALYSLFERQGIQTRTISDALRGKANRPRTRVPVGDAPMCKCGCGSSTAWNRKKDRWNRYVSGHYRKDAPYKSQEWLTQEYDVARRTLAELAIECGVATSSIARSMDKLGIRRRDRSQSRIGRHAGSRNPAWKGGVTPERQRLYKTQKWRALVSECFARDGYRCIRCDTPKRGRIRFHAHHVAPWADNPGLRMDIDNLVTLCDTCHLWVHSRKNVVGEYLV